MKQTFCPVVYFTTLPTGNQQNIFKTFYLNNSYIIFKTTLIKGCSKTNYLKTMYSLNNALNPYLSLVKPVKMALCIKKINRLQWDGFHKQIQIVQEISIKKILIELINNIFKKYKNAF